MRRSWLILLCPLVALAGCDKILGVDKLRAFEGQPAAEISTEGDVDDPGGDADWEADPTTSGCAGAECSRSCPDVTLDCVTGEYPVCGSIAMSRCCPANAPALCEYTDGHSECRVSQADCGDPGTCDPGALGCGALEVGHCGTNGPSRCCSAAQHEVFCDVPGYGTACLSEGTVCESAHQCPDLWVVCKADEVADCSPAGGSRCCPAALPKLCQGAGGASSCQPADSSCDTVLTCGFDGLAHSCLPGETPFCAETGGAFLCCPMGTTIPCDVPGFAPACWPSGTDCSSQIDCAGTVQACDSGKVSHCDSTGTTLLCCSPEKPRVCEKPGIGATCIGDQDSCDTLTKCGDTLFACAADLIPGCGAATGAAQCCPAATPVVCDKVGVEGSQCSATDQDCGTLTPCLGALRTCPTGQTVGCGLIAQTWKCCPATDPQFCEKEGVGNSCEPAANDCSTLTKCNWPLGFKTCPTGQTVSCSMFGGSCVPN